MDCTWPGNDALMQQYHQEEWGKPLHDDKKLFEFLVLDTFQAGLSWKTILHRRAGFKKAFANFNAKKVAAFNDADVLRLMQDEGIIRNRLKIKATIKNAQEFLRIQQVYGSFDKYIWQFTNGEMKPRKHMSDVPTTSLESDAMSKALRKEGFSFVGSTICYAFMQAAGMVNDHLITCSANPAVLKK